MYKRKVNPMVIRLKALHTLNNIVCNSVIILDTPYGLLTHTEALRLKTGGQLICLIL